MLTFLDTLLGHIAPHECLACSTEGALLCSVCLPLLPEVQPQCYRCHRTDNAQKTCKACRRQTPIQVMWIGTQYEGFAEGLVRSLKFHRAVAAADTIAASLAEQFGESLPKGSVIVPVPTATSRVRKRGYDQSVLIAKALAKKVQLPYSATLVRVGQARQTGSARSQRTKQLLGAFQAKTNRRGGVQEIILVDDVLTTGATLEAAARTLRQAGVKKVSAVVFARAL